MQIGDSLGARDFLREIEEDAEVKQHVYVSTENIADGRVAGMSLPKMERENDLWVSLLDSYRKGLLLMHKQWVKSLLKAIEH